MNKNERKIKKMNENVKFFKERVPMGLIFGYIMNKNE